MSSVITDLPLWFLVSWIVLSFLIAYYFYRPVKWVNTISKKLRFLLLGLRFLGLSLLGVLILGFLIEDKSYTKEKPIFLTLLDNSSSMLNYSDSSEVKIELLNYSSAVNEQFSGEFECVTYNLDSLTTLQDSVGFTAKTSDLSAFFQKTYETYYGRNLGAIVLVSDGNYNKGVNPVSTAQKIKMTPVYTLGVGDTIQRKDQLINNVNHNDVAFLGNKFPVEVVVSSFLMNGESTELSIKQDDKILAKEIVSYSEASEELVKIVFYIEATKVGVVDFEVELAVKEGESNLKNNSKTIYIEVLDDRSKVLLVGGAPHPDLGAIKQVLTNDVNLEVTALRIEDLPENLSVYDLIICHEPGRGKSGEKLKQLRDASVPIWYIFGSLTKQTDFTDLGLPIWLDYSGQTDLVRGAWNRMFTKFELDEEARSVYSKLPPLTIPFGKLKINQPIDVLFYQQVGPVVKKDPLIFSFTQKERKVAVTLGEGMWRWKLTEYQKYTNNSAFDQLIAKTVQYLSVKANTSRLRVYLPTIFDENEVLTFKAAFYNESFDPVVNVPIEMTVTNEEAQELIYDFIPQVNNYKLELGQLPAGDYSWKVVAEDQGEIFTKEGSFTVKKVEIEALSSVANHNILYRIAENSNASFDRLKNYNSVLTEISNREDIAPVSYESVHFKKLVDYKWLFFLLVMVFIFEWFLRRYYGSY